MPLPLLLLTLLFASLLAWGEHRVEPVPVYVGGIQVNEPDHGAWLDGLAASHLHTVAVTVYARQGDWDSDNLWWSEEEEAVEREVARAKARGFRVVLILRVALDHAFERNRFLWHGMIMPRSESEIDEWFARYRRFTERWARFAEREGVDLFGIGSELSALASTVRVRELPHLEEYWANPEKVGRENERLLAAVESLGAPVEVPAAADGTRLDSLSEYLEQYADAHGRWARQVGYLDEREPIRSINRRRALLEDHWLRVIAVVRAAYRGEITFAANFDQYEQVSFWPALDLIGINAYFPLRDAWTPRLDADGYRRMLRAGWRRILSNVDRFRGGQGLLGHDVLFSELGYVRRENCSLRPWASGGMAIVPDGESERLVDWGAQREDSIERTAALQALADVRAEGVAPYLRGALYWKLSTLRSHRAIEPFVILLGEADDAEALTALARLGMPVAGG